MADITKSYPFYVVQWSHLFSLKISTLNFPQPKVTSVTSFFLCNKIDDTARPKETKQKQSITHITLIKHCHPCLIGRKLETNNIPLFSRVYTSQVVYPISYINTSSGSGQPRIWTSLGWITGQETRIERQRQTTLLCLVKSLDNSTHWSFRVLYIWGESWRLAKLLQLWNNQLQCVYVKKQRKYYHKCMAVMDTSKHNCSNKKQQLGNG